MNKLKITLPPLPEGAEHADVYVGVNPLVFYLDKAYIRKDTPPPVLLGRQHKDGSFTPAETAAETARPE